MNSLARLTRLVSQNWSSHFLVSSSTALTQTRNIKKHWNPRYRHLRGAKFLKVDIPDYDELRRDYELTPDEIRSRLKKKGIAPVRPWNEKPFYLSCTDNVFEPYVPPEGDGKIDLISKSGAKQRVEYLTKKSKSYMAVRKIRTFEESFDLPDLANELQQKFIKAHEILITKDEDKLLDYVTEKCIVEMMMNVKLKTIRWKFLNLLELPRIVHVRCTDIITKDNIFAQVTLRMHSQQTLAVYDRFGRLMHGGEDVVKDVLEYVVFEKHLANLYGDWKIHGKVIPDWMPPKDPIKRTYVKEPDPPLEVEEPPKPEQPQTDQVSDIVAQPSSSTPAMANV